MFAVIFVFLKSFYSCWKCFLLVFKPAELFDCSLFKSLTLFSLCTCSEELTFFVHQSINAPDEMNSLKISILCFFLCEK